MCDDDGVACTKSHKFLARNNFEIPKERLFTTGKINMVFTQNKAQMLCMASIIHVHAPETFTETKVIFCLDFFFVFLFFFQEHIIQRIFNKHCSFRAVQISI